VEKTSRLSKIGSAIFFLAGVATLALIGVAYGKKIYRDRQIQKEIAKLQQEIEQLNQENSRLNNLVNYFSSQDFKEKEAREKLNLQKEDEKVVIFKKESMYHGEEVQDKKESQPLTDEAEDKVPNWKKWWQYFFGGGKVN